MQPANSKQAVDSIKQAEDSAFPISSTLNQAMSSIDKNLFAQKPEASNKKSEEAKSNSETINQTFAVAASYNEMNS